MLTRGGSKLLADSARFLNAFFTAAPAGLAILDRELRYVRLNETLAAMNGRSVDAHLGCTVREVLPELAPDLEPILRHILATGEPALNIDVNGETAAEPGAPRSWIASYFPLLGRRAEAVGIGAIVVEQTQRRRAEQAQRRSGAEYRAIVESATYGIYRSSVDGRFLTVNPALVQMLGYDSDAAVLALDLARDVYVHPEQRLELIEQLGGVERVQGQETEWRRADGHRITVRLSGRAVRSPERALLGFEMMAEDVTEQRALEQALRQAQKMETIGQLTSGIAHDFNNLLTVILAHAHLLEEMLPTTSPDVQRELTELRTTARRGADLVHKLLGFSRSERLELQPLDVGPWVHELVGTIRRLLPSNIEIGCDAESTEAVVRADPGALQQILMNLATNARDAMPDGGKLHLEVRRARLDEEDRPLHAWIQPGPYACVAVSDSGVGMDEPTQARVFEPFFTTKSPGVGTGLGMAMVYGLVKQHRGFVHLYSAAGHGTTVKVYLPLGIDLSASATETEDRNHLPGGGETILVVEDDPRLQSVAARLLEKVGYRVLVASDGREGLERYRAHAAEIELLITDLMMPRLTGLELYRLLRKDHEDLRVLFHSGYPVLSIRESVGSDPAVAILTKPWTASEFLQHVRGLLDSRVRKPI